MSKSVYALFYSLITTFIKKWNVTRAKLLCSFVLKKDYQYDNSYDIITSDIKWVNICHVTAPY